MFTKDELIEVMDKFEKLSINKMLYETDESKLLLEKNKNQVVTENERENFETALIKGEEDADFVKAQMVGIFYLSSSKEEGDFVKVGDKVKKGETIGVIEAMKVLNEIQAEASGTIEEILVEDGDVVEFDQPIYKISKD